MNFEQILIDLNTPVAPESHRHSRSGWVQFDCPFCGKSTFKYHMGYNRAGRYVNCWRCGRHDLATTLLHLGCKSLSQAKTYVGQLPIERSLQRRLGGGTLKLPKYGKLEKAHKKYLKKRNFRPKELERLWGIGGIGISARLGWRVFIPIYLGGQVVSYTTRSIADVKSKYITATPEESIIHPKHVLYGEDYVRDTVVICEGPLDVWAFGPGAVATFGTGWSEQQMMRLTSYRRRIVLFDPEPEAQQRARKLISALEPYRGFTANALLDSDNDVADLSRKDRRLLREELLTE